MKKRIMVIGFSLVIAVSILSLTFVSPAFAQHKKVTVRLYTNPPGGLMYTMGFALCQLINKHSKWLRCHAIETTSTYENLRDLVGHPELDNIWFGEATTIGVDQLSLGLKPYKGIGPWKGTKWLALMANIGVPLITLNPNIKTGRDLSGKRFGLGPRGSTNSYMPRWLMKYAWGNWSKVIKEYGNSPNIAVNRLIGGTVDATWQGAVLYGPGKYKKWFPIPSFDRLLSARKIYFLKLNEKDMAKVRKKKGLEAFRLIYGRAEKQGINHTPKWAGLLNQIGWLVSKNMPADTVTEIMRILYTYANQFATYSPAGKGITKQSLGQLSVPRQSYDRAAIKFLESKGQKVGLPN